MVPYGLSEQQFVTRYRRCLDRISNEFISALREHISLPVPETVEEAEVQIFLGDDGMETPNAWIYYQGHNNKVDSSDPSIFPGKSMELPMDLSSVDDFDEEYYTDEEFGGINIIGNTVKEWLAECWWKAGGWSYQVPTKVWVHDDFGNGEPIELSEHR